MRGGLWYSKRIKGAFYYVNAATLASVYKGTIQLHLVH